MAIDREYQDQRRKAILEILAERPIERQFDLVDALRDLGFEVTQSSVSRDLNALGILRREGAYRLPDPQGDEGALGKMEEFIRGVNNAGPYMLVLDTSPGMAKAVAVALKSAAWPEVKGILPEDNSLFIATDNVYDTRLLFQRFERIVGSAGQE